MKSINIKKIFKSKGRTGNIIILIASIVLVYLLGLIYFSGHFFFRTVINGVDVSLKAHDDAEGKIRSFIKDYELQLIERGGETEKIKGQDIGLKYNEKNSISKIHIMQKPFMWIGSLLKGQKYYVDDLYVYDNEGLENKIGELKCLNIEVIEPQNVNFRYSDGTYQLIQEVYGNKINRDTLDAVIKMGVLKGERKLDLNKNNCYENPKYTLRSEETPKARELLNKCVKSKITYVFGSEKEILDGNIINEWLSVDENLEVVVSEMAAMRYLHGLGKKYDTVGVARNFKTSIGKIVEVKGGLYGWKIDRAGEAKALIEIIKQGETVEKEPVYAQKASSRGKDEIGSTYVEINITRQRLWFYKDGRLIAQGSVVTGNPNRGHATKTGTYFLNYKDKGATLVGQDYEAEVTYWMPFFGNIGLHDATWRYSFGGEIYRTKGSHGCVNAPLYLAKKIFENIEEGTPIVVYEEEEKDG